MAVVTRKIVRIDEERCDGCGVCVPSCAEGAIQIIDGKARLISDTYCDGLGACLGECPQDAITLEDRTAEEFDEEAVQLHLAQQAPSQPEPIQASSGCPGAAMRDMRGTGTDSQAVPTARPTIPSALSNWPIQIHLVPVSAPYLAGARLTIAADCTPFAYSDFHPRFIKDRVVLVGCPKLDDSAFYVEKLSELFRSNEILEIEVPYMEVPCCGGLIMIVQTALMNSGKPIPLTLTKIGLQGTIQESRSINISPELSETA